VAMEVHSTIEVIAVADGDDNFSQQEQRQHNNSESPTNIITGNRDNDVVRSPGIMEDAALFIPIAGEAAPGLDDDELLCRMKVQHEISRYNATRTNLEGDFSKDVDILQQWWQANEKHFPILWKLAQVYLAIPATSAASEHAYSTAGNIVTAKHNRLNPDLVQACHLIHENAWALKETKAHLYQPASNIKTFENEEED